MPKVFLTPLLIAGLLLLTSCSNSQKVKPIKSETEKFLECEYAQDNKQNAYAKYEQVLKEHTIIMFDNYNKTGSYDSPETKSASDQMEVALEVMNLIIVNNPSCFSPSVVTEAKSQLR